MTGHDVVLVLFEERTKNFFHVLGQIVGADFCGVGQTIHHVGDAAVLETFGNSFPTVLNEFGGVARLNAELDHAIETQNRPGL